MALKVGNLTPGEKLYIARRRSGLTQHKYAAELNQTHYIYRRWENETPNENDPTPPKVKLGALKPHEKCLLLRRREGLRILDVSEGSGLPVQTITKIERGVEDAAPLVEYWSA